MYFNYFFLFIFFSLLFRYSPTQEVQSVTEERQVLQGAVQAVQVKLQS
jgi:hypothetical protein